MSWKMTWSIDASRVMMFVIKDVRPDMEMVLTANNIKVCNEEKAKMNLSEEMSKQFESFWSSQSNRPLFARDHIIRSFCPMICGLYKVCMHPLVTSSSSPPALGQVKLSLLLALIGGVPRSDTAGTRTRGESHCLIIGDPGLGKSQLLKYCAKVGRSGEGGAYPHEGSDTFQVEPSSSPHHRHRHYKRRSDSDSTGEEQVEVLLGQVTPCTVTEGQRRGVGAGGWSSRACRWRSLLYR